MIPKNKVIFTPEKEKRVLDYVRFVSICAELIKIEYGDIMIDHRFKSPQLNNHSRRIIESAEAISRSLSSIAENTDREGFLYDGALQVHRLLKHFFTLSGEQISEFMDLIDDEMKKLELA